MQIGGLTINGSAFLAPMAGVADRAFRELCMEHGASYFVTELISAKGITYGDKGSKELLQIGNIARPCAIQLFGDEPDVMARAAQTAANYAPEVIDINMGCPAPKVSGHGSGCALMKNPKLVYDIVKAVRTAVDIPVTVKIRAGWDENSINAVEVALAAESAGADMIAIHGRTKKQMYAPPVNLEIIRRVKENVSVPVVGNGDIRSPEDAAHMMDYTGCDAVMVGRGALGNPWIFEQINSYLEKAEKPAPVTVRDKMETMIAHTQRICEYKGEYVGMREARKHAAWYLKGLANAAQYRRQTSSLEKLEDIKSLAERVLEENE